MGLGFFAALAPGLALAEPKKPETREICPRFSIQGKLEPALSETETKLICGGEGAWSEIPFNQMRFNLKNFLQDRGYYHPSYLISAPAEWVGRPGAPGTHLTLHPGEPTRVSSLEAVGGPEALRLRRKRKVIGEVMTPKLLGGVEQWVFQRLQALGYPCPKVKSEADPDTGAVVVHVEPGPLQDLVSVTEEQVPGARPGILRRYDAFNLGRLFNGDLLTVTENRIARIGLVQNAYFTVSCGERGASARQEVSAGPPRLLTFGFGFNTEGLLLGRASWRNTRVGDLASLVDVTAQVSTKDQRLLFVSNWYNFPFVSRRYSQPSLEIRHQNETAFETLSVTGKWLASTTWDSQVLGVEAGVGPALDFIRTYQGSGRLEPNSFFASLETVARVRTHEFEYWATSPRTGADLSATLDLSNRALLSSATAHRFSLVGETLWNLQDYDPPLWVIGFRGGFYVTLSPERPGPATRLPANFFRYLGGSQDLRGFDRQSVPLQGAMTAWFGGLEARLVSVLPFGLEPVVFTDLGVVGSQPGAFDSPLLYSPGSGMRWKSPVGVLRTTLARGFPVSPSGGWTFYFSFGEEF